jgi:hypothetical protein
MRRCYNFTPAVSVVIGDPAEFLNAIGWCRSKWLEERQYRVEEGSRRNGPGTFEFADTTHAVEFSLKFGWP